MQQCVTLMEVESCAIGPNPNADPAYIIIIAFLPDTVGYAGPLTSALKHKQGDISMLFTVWPCWTVVMISFLLFYRVHS